MIDDTFENSGYCGYRIKLIVAIEQITTIAYRNELIVPIVFKTISEARRHIDIDIKRRLKDSLYFRSQKKGFDLVLYGQLASSNTYLAYRVLPLKAGEQETEATRNITK